MTVDIQALDLLPEPHSELAVLPDGAGLMPCLVTCTSSCYITCFFTEW